MTQQDPLACLPGCPVAVKREPLIALLTKPPNYLIKEIGGSLNLNPKMVGAMEWATTDLKVDVGPNRFFVLIRF